VGILPINILTNSLKVGIIPTSRQHGGLMQSRELIKLLEADGWKEVGRSGSHRTFSKEGVREIITIPHPRKDTSKGILRQVQKYTGMKLL
jgi:predicted RNA binding protein YcfA (HicA-like mRNA interferase family)